MLGRVLQVILLFLPLTAFADHEPWPYPRVYSFYQTMEIPLRFEEVELLGRHAGVGGYRAEDIRLNRWVSVDNRVRTVSFPRIGAREVSGDTYIGIDQHGRLIQLLQLADRRVAFVLSGDLKLKTFLLTTEWHLIAIAEDGRVFQFDQNLWSRNPMIPVLRNALLRWVGLLGFGGLALWQASPWLEGFFPGLSMQYAAATGAAGYTLLEFLNGARRYETANENHMGLREWTYVLPNFLRMEPELDPETELVLDYSLIGEEYNATVFSLLQPSLGFDPEARGNFAYRCEHELLPRGRAPGAPRPY